MSSIRDQILADLSQQPNDWNLRGMLADWCEDNHQTEAADALRWMVRHQKRPYHGSTSTRASWFNADTIGSGLGDPESDLPQGLFAHLAGGKAVANHMTFESITEAEEAFLAAWDLARGQGWSAD